MAGFDNPSHAPRDARGRGWKAWGNALKVGKSVFRELNEVNRGFTAANFNYPSRLVSVTNWSAVISVDTS